MPCKKYNTPHRSRVVKTRMTEEEYADFAARLAPYGISQSEFIRRAVQGATSAMARIRSTRMSKAITTSSALTHGTARTTG